MTISDAPTIPLVLVIDYGEKPLDEVEGLLAALPSDLPDCRQVVVVSGYRARAVLITAGAASRDGDDEPPPPEPDEP